MSRLGITRICWSLPMDLTHWGEKSVQLLYITPSLPLSQYDERKARGLNMDSHIHASSTRTDMRKRKRARIERTGLGLMYQ